MATHREHGEEDRPAGRFADLQAMPHGAMIRGDLSRPLSPADRAELRRLFLQFGLLLFPDQTLTLDQQVDIMGSIGPVLNASDGIGYVSTDESKGALGLSELKFHSDLDFSPYPYRALSLLAIDVAERETSTKFASNLRGYEMLMAEDRDRLAPLSLITALPSDYARGSMDMEITDDVLHVMRPPIVPHPDTGEPMLMVSQQAARFEGMEREASRALLQHLATILYEPQNVHEHFWRNGDFVIWDNFAFQHARSLLRSERVRTLQRVVVGECSFFDLPR